MLLLTLLGPVVASADTAIVDYDGIPPNFSNLQDGIDAVSDGGTVWVIATISSGPEQVSLRGPRNRGLDFGGKNITLMTFGGPQKFAIDCEGMDRAILLSSGIDSTCHITGFTFMNGQAGDGGGAIRCDGGSPRISDCVFRDNSTSGSGGAIMLTQGPTRISGCEFYGNTAGDVGGALHITNSDVKLTACTFSDNSAGAGGGAWVASSALTMKLCTLANNEGIVGSSVWLQSGTVATLQQCVLAFGRLGRPVTGGTPEIFHCCVYGNADGDDLPGTAHDNEFVDPLICDLYGADGGNMSLCSNSPCLSSNNTWSLQVGSKVQGCADCDTPVEPSSWSGIKALYR